MQSKVLMFLCVLLTVLFLVSSTDVAKETKPDGAQSTQLPEEVKEPQQQYGGGCRYGCCRWGNYGGCRWCCRANEAESMETDHANNQQVDEMMEPNQQGGGGRGGGGGGGGGGGRCRYGCCGGWGPYGCRRCCRGNEAESMVTDQANNQQVDEMMEPNQQGGGGRGGGGGGGGGGGRCRYGCCGGWGPYGCRRCCYSANEVMDGN